jgi:outer membrane protein insertion porin family
MHQQSYPRARTKIALATLAFVAAANPLLSWAVDPFTVQDIRVEGLQRVEPGTVFASLPFKVGEQYNDEKGAAAIRALFALGLFKDVRLDVAGNVLVVIVEERPTVASVDFSGVKEFDKDVLIRALRDVGLAEGRPLDKALTDRAEQELKRQYINKSLYGAQVISTITPVERNRVNVSFTVVEGDVAKIKTINIVGNQAFATSTLRGLFDLDTGGWLSWYTKSDRYSRAKLNADIETLRSYYLSRGYLDFKVDSTQVAISPSKEDIAITLNISEGQRFFVSGVTLEGNFLGKDDEFKSLVKIRPGQAYNADDVADTDKAFTEYFGTFGFAFARVEVRPEVDRANNRVAFVIAAEPSRRAYVRRINVAGNNRTRDEVIRREFRQFESSWYDGDKIRLSRDRVDRLGYFKEVSVETQDVPGSPDQVDVLVTVVEKPTGNLLLGAGYSSADKLSLTASVKQENAFGSGNYLGIELNTSDSNRQLVLSTIDPYFTTDGVSRALDVFYRTSRPSQSDQEDTYKLVTTGGGVRFGVPFSENDTVFFGLNAERTEIVPGTSIPAAYLAYGSQFGLKSTTFPLTLGWTRDDRDSALVPSTGRYQRLNADLALAGDARYLRTNYQYQQYIPLNKQYTLAFNGEFGWGKGLSNRPYPVFKNFFAGGLGSVRGYEQSTLGPRDITGSYLGGAKKLNFNLEMLAPFPGAGTDRSLRWYGFVDAGTVYAEDQPMRVKDMKASVGVGLSWISPIGPLRFSYAKPLRTQAGDKIQKLQFQIGTSF